MLCEHRGQVDANAGRTRTPACAAYGNDFACSLLGCRFAITRLTIYAVNGGHQIRCLNGGIDELSGACPNGR